MNAHALVAAGLVGGLSITAHAGRIIGTQEKVASVMMGAGGIYVYVQNLPEKAYVIDRTVVDQTGLSTKELSEVLLSRRSSVRFIVPANSQAEHRINVTAVTEIIESAE